MVGGVCVSDRYGGVDLCGGGGDCGGDCARDDFVSGGADGAGESGGEFAE